MTERNARLLSAMAGYDAGDVPRVQHFVKVHGFAAAIGRAEGLDERTLDVLEAAAIVHDIGIHAAERKHGSNAGGWQQVEGPPEARALLEGVGGFSPEEIDRICFLVGHHHTYEGVDGPDWRILLEADFLVNAHEDRLPAAAVRAARARIFRTESGLRLLDSIYGNATAAPAAFRPMRRFGQTLSEEEVREVLRAAKRGVLSVVGDDGRPYGVYLNPLYDEATGRLYFHGAKEGHKIDALRRDPRASFTVIDEGSHDASRPPEWALTFRSVVVFGRVEFVENQDEALEICRRLSRRFTQDEAAIEDEIRRAGARVLVFALVPEHVTGKRVHEA